MLVYKKNVIAHIIQRIVSVKCAIYNKIQFILYYGYGQRGLFYGNIIMNINYI